MASISWIIDETWRPGESHPQMWHKCERKSGPEWKSVFLQVSKALPERKLELESLLKELMKIQGQLGDLSIWASNTRAKLEQLEEPPARVGNTLFLHQNLNCWIFIERTAWFWLKMSPFITPAHRGGASQTARSGVSFGEGRSAVQEHSSCRQGEESKTVTSGDPLKLLNCFIRFWLIKCVMLESEYWGLLTGK